MNNGVSARFSAWLIAVLALAACSPAPNPDSDLGAPSPPLYEILDESGEVEGWLLGTIHALPEGTVWRTEQIDTVIGKADTLVVEVASLRDRNEIQSVFTDLATTPGQPAITSRVSEDHRGTLLALIDTSSYDAEDFEAIETWAVALMLGQVHAQGDPQYGVDRAVIQAFAGRGILELEGAEKQLGIFDSLPEADQRDLLEGVLSETRQAIEDPGRLRRAWLINDEATLIEATETGIMADPELRKALLVDRNIDWIEQLDPILALEARPLIAVGAAHLVGPDGLVRNLSLQGYSVRSLQ